MISSAVRKAGPFHGAGSTGPYTFAFKVLAAADLYVVKLTVATGVETVLALTTHYTVSLNANQNNNPGGTITLVSALAVGYDLTISSAAEALQPVDVTNQGGFYPSVHNDAFDRSTILIQQAEEKLARSIKYPISDPSTGATLPAYAQRASTVLAFDSTGAPVAGPAVASVGAVFNIANINTVVGIDTEVTTVSGISANVTTVAGVAANVTTVAGVAANVTTVAGNTTNINKVAAIDTDVSAVAAIDTETTTVAGIDTEIVAVAANITDVTNFADVYYGPAAADPATRKDGSALQTGDLYFNTVSAAMRVYNTDTSAWAVAYTNAVTFATAAEITTGTEPAKAIAPDQAVLALMKVSGANLAIGSDADGDMYYRASSALARLAKGTANFKLFMNAGADWPEWAKGITAGVYSRDSSLDSSTQTISGIGYLPSAAIIIAGLNDNMSWSIVTNSTTFCLAISPGYPAASGSYDDGRAFTLYPSESNGVYATITFNSDGGGVNWVKLGNPVGTVTFQILWIR